MRQLPTRFPPLRREGDRLATGEDHLDNVRRQEGKADRPTDMRDLLPVAFGNRRDCIGLAAAQVVESAMRIGDEFE